MNNFLTPSTLQLFLYYVLPGVVATLTWDLLVPKEHRNFNESLIEVIAFSTINLAIWNWLISLLNQPNVKITYPLWYNIGMIWTLVLAPVFEVVIMYQMLQLRFFRDKFPNPTLEVWDDIFKNGKSYYVIFHLKSGERIGGLIGINSTTSTFPRPHEIYLEKIWDLGEEPGTFVKERRQNAGAFIKFDDCDYLELYEATEETKRKRIPFFHRTEKVLMDSSNPIQPSSIPTIYSSRQPRITSSLNPDETKARKPNTPPTKSPPSSPSSTPGNKPSHPPTKSPPSPPKKP